MIKDGVSQRRRALRHIVVGGWLQLCLLCASKSSRRATFRGYCLFAGLLCCFAAVAGTAYGVVVPAPTFSPAAGTYASAQSVTISDSYTGATPIIYYTTNGTTPTTSSAVYTGGYILVSATETVKAIAVVGGEFTSPVASAAYTIESVVMPTFSLAPGTYIGSQSVTISDATSGATIYYTTNGTTPTTSSTEYTGPITVSATETVEAIAALSGYTSSTVGSAAYTILLATPTFFPAAGTYTGSQSVTISATAGASIYYTTNGATPTASSTEYTGAISVSATETIEAIAILGTNTSAVGTTTYVLGPIPTFPAGIINTVAGNGTSSFSGDGGAATSAEMYYPQGVAVDGAGNFYIADKNNNRIRKVTASSGIIVTVAGNGTAGSSGDGGPAISAELDTPYGVAVDSAGNIYIADTYNNRIRKVTVSTGEITTVAGNGIYAYSGDGAAATSAELAYPWAVAVDSADNIYIADIENNRIRVVNTGSSTITVAGVTIAPGAIATVAGNGTAGYAGDGRAATSAELNNPWGVAVDSAYNIYISDVGNNRVREVTASTGVIATIAGNGTAGYAGDGGAATSAELYFPYGVALDNYDNFYIGDESNSRVRKVTASTGIIVTVAGDATAGYSGDGGVATSAELHYPAGVAVDSSGNIYIADYFNSRIRAVGPLAISYVSPSVGAVGSSVAIIGAGFGSTQGTSTLTFNGTKATSIASWNANSIVATVPAGATTGNVVVTVGGILSNGSPFTVVVAPSIIGLSSTSGVPGNPITITGNNFGATQGTSAVLFNGVVAAPTGWGNASIAVPVPANASTGPVTVVVDGLTSNGVTFTDTSAPIITSISPPSGTVGTSVTINGSLFGPSQGTSTVTFNGVAVVPTTWNANGQQIVASAPTGVTTGNVVVTVNGIASNGIQFVAAPTIVSLSPPSGGIGAAVTITGTNFGSTQGTSTVKFGTTAATPPTWGLNTLVVPVPAGASTGNVVVTVGGVASNGVSFTVTSAPGISSISPPTAAVGTPVTIYGSGFGSSKGTSTLTFNGVAPTTIGSWGPTAIQATVPAGGVPGPVVVNVNGQASNPFQLVIPPSPPQITGLSFTFGPPQMGFVINGANFGPQAVGLVSVGGVTVTSVTWSSTAITVQVPVGAPIGNADVVVTSGVLSSQPAYFLVTQTFGCTLPLD
jgi:hypothetical protein